MEKNYFSICIPVYNQIEMVRECVAKALEYTGNDIEIIVNDDCSTDDIEGMIKSFNDSRVRYYRNETNLGHDLNIIQSFRHAKSEYAFLLRVRDRILPGGIPLIIERIKENPNLAYLTGNAIDEKGNLRLAYHTERMKKGNEALNGHKRLYVHPSGSLYSVKLLDLDKLENFIRERIDTKYGFLSHNMMRIFLATAGDFEFVCDAPVWQYTITLNATDIAVNSDKNKVSVFAPVYAEQRFLREMEWADEALPDEYKQSAFRFLERYYLDFCTWGFKRRNEEESLRYHYNCEKMDFSVSKERKNFKKIAYKKIEELSIDINQKKSLKSFLKKKIFKNKTYSFVRFYLAKIFRGTFVYTIHKKRNVQKGKT